ncbi:hypothetical protein DL769_002365 [Monosporascus sp. CRB-8-3]|nr:hypothetical protein DL769_002365 [Monosporascus sp. CRB-8-3]
MDSLLNDFEQWLKLSKENLVMRAASQQHEHTSPELGPKLLLQSRQSSLDRAEEDLDGMYRDFKEFADKCRTVNNVLLENLVLTDDIKNLRAEIEHDMELEGVLTARMQTEIENRLIAADELATDKLLIGEVRDPIEVVEYNTNGASSLGFWGVHQGNLASVLDTATEKNVLLRRIEYHLSECYRIFKNALGINAEEEIGAS